MEIGGFYKSEKDNGKCKVDDDGKHLVNMDDTRVDNSWLRV